MQAGQVLARLDPTFAAADLGALTARSRACGAEVGRLQAEVDGQAVRRYRRRSRPGAAGGDLRPAQGRVQFQDGGLRAEVADWMSIDRTIALGCCRLPRPPWSWRKNVEQMRTELEKLQVGSRLNTLAAMDNRAEMARTLANAEETEAGAKRGLAAHGRRARWLCWKLARRRVAKAGRGDRQADRCARAAATRRSCAATGGIARRARRRPC